MGRGLKIMKTMIEFGTADRNQTRREMLTLNAWVYLFLLCLGYFGLLHDIFSTQELSVTATSDGANVSMAVYRGGTKVTRCFK